MQVEMHASILNWVRASLHRPCTRLRGLLDAATARASKSAEMLAASFGKLNAEFGFGLSMPKAPELDRFVRELSLIERNYVQYLGLTQALRLSQPKFMEQFPPHAGQQAAGRVRKRDRRARAVEQIGVGPGRAQLREAAAASGAGARRSSASRTRPASSSCASPRSRTGPPLHQFLARVVI